jgi:copper oxidase (laccase) domain-containing protein
LGFDPVIERDGQTRLDLAATNQRQLAAAGIPAQAIETRAICTSCHVDDFYSHRAEGGRTGRFAALIGLE